jgi:hypothetical protein
MPRLGHGGDLDGSVVVGVDDAQGAKDGEVAREAEQPVLLLDPDALRRAVLRLETGTYRENGDAQLLEVITLHLSIRAFL